VPLSALDATDKEKVDVLHLTDPWAKRKLYVCLRRQNSDANPFLVGLVATLSPDAGCRATGSGSVSKGQGC